MPRLELVGHGQHVMTVCNACRYCEQFCPVFPAMEQRLVFAEADLDYLANLCHNCGECLYACQYAPPHEFGINVPATLAAIRVESYEKYCWPRPLAVIFHRHSVARSIVLAAPPSIAADLARRAQPAAVTIRNHYSGKRATLSPIPRDAQLRRISRVPRAE